MDELPQYFVWQKPGNESSQTISSNFNIKEAQRSHNPSGVFLWGVGNSIGKDTLSLLLEKTNNNPLVVFSEIISDSRPQDITYINTKEKTLKLWTRAKQKNGSSFAFPAGSQVVSTLDSPGEQHYALVCQSDIPLRPNWDSGLEIRAREMRHIRTGGKLQGKSALYVVDKTPPREPMKQKTFHKMLLAVRLVEPYFVTLTDPIVISNVTVDPETGLYPV